MSRQPHIEPNKWRISHPTFFLFARCRCALRWQPVNFGCRRRRVRHLTQRATCVMPDACTVWNSDPLRRFNHVMIIVEWNSKDLLFNRTELLLSINFRSSVLRIRRAAAQRFVAVNAQSVLAFFVCYDFLSNFIWRRTRFHSSQSAARYWTVAPIRQFTVPFVGRG